MKKILLLGLIILNLQVFTQVPDSPVLKDPPVLDNAVSITPTIDWFDVSGADCYYFEITSDTNTVPAIYDICNAPQSSYTVPESEVLIPNTWYYWRVKAHNASGWSAYSGYFWFRTGGNLAQEFAHTEDLINAMVSVNSLNSVFGNILINRMNHAETQYNANHFNAARIHVITFRLFVRILDISNFMQESDAHALYNEVDWIIPLVVAAGNLPNPNPNPKELSLLPSKFELKQNFPNPFNPSTYIEYSIPGKSFVSIIVYDILGKEVTTLVNSELNAGTYMTEFNASNLSSGVYFYSLRTKDFVETKRMLLTK